MASVLRRLKRLPSCVGFRLFGAYAVSIVCISGLGYELITRGLAHSLIVQTAAVQQADSRYIVEVSKHHKQQPVAVREIQEVLSAVSSRAGVVESLLVDRRGVVRAAGHAKVVGTKDPDSFLAAAVREGKSYAGREADPNRDPQDFEFVTPLRLFGEPYALELTYDHHVFEAQLRSVRYVMIVLGLLALVLGGAVFYLVGGRGLLRSHRFALQRATLDGLTDLPNQRAFDDEVPRAVANAARHEEPLTLAVIDLDDFKFSNDRHGHAHGDTLLCRLAGLLLDGRTGDRAYRIGGDEFALLLPYTDAEGSRTLAHRLARHASEAGLKISIGVSTLRPGLAPDLLRAEADAALYEAKRVGDQTIHFEDIRERTNITTSKGRAAVHALLEERRITTLFQPIWNLNTGTLIGVEALSRPHPDYGFAGPAEAFDIAEQVGRVHQLDVLCATNALAAAAELPEETLLFLNICPQTLDLDSDQNEWLVDLVTQAGLTPNQVVIEVTERFGARTAAVAKCLQHLHSHGFKIALDDVGTGNQGLEMLRTVNAEFVKLDRSIVTAATTEATARALLIALATFAHQTGAFVIAEGIEDTETLDILRNLGDDLSTFGDEVIGGGQGYGLGLPADTIDPDFPNALRVPAVAN